MKKILILLAAICCCGCSNDIPKTREQAFITKTNFIGPIDERIAAFHIEKEAKELIENRLKRLKNVKRDYHKGLTPSYCYGWTGKTWTNENTGEQEEEVYKFKLTQI